MNDTKDISEENSDHVVVIEPALPAIKELLQTVAKPTLKVHRASNTDEAVALVSQHSPCLLICCIEDIGAINLNVRMIRSLHPDIKKGNVKTMVLSRIKSPQLKQLLSEFGVNDYNMDPMPARTLFFKYNLQLNALTATKKRLALLNSSSKELVFKKEGEKVETSNIAFKAQNATPLEQTPPLRIPEDQFVSGKHPPKKEGGKFVFEMKGPPPTTGSWQRMKITTSTEKPRYRWVPHDPVAPEQKDQGTGWVHEGDEPIFNSQDMLWQLASDRPDLSYLRGNIKQCSKISVNSHGQPIIAADSEHAIRKIKEYYGEETKDTRLSADIFDERKIVVSGSDSPQLNTTATSDGQAQGLASKHGQNYQQEMSESHQKLTRRVAALAKKGGSPTLLSLKNRDKEDALPLPRIDEIASSLVPQERENAAALARDFAQLRLPKEETDRRRASLLEQLKQVTAERILPSTVTDDEIDRIAAKLGIQPGTQSKKQILQRDQAEKIHQIYLELELLDQEQKRGEDPPTDRIPPALSDHPSPTATQSTDNSKTIEASELHQGSAETAKVGPQEFASLAESPDKNSPVIADLLVESQDPRTRMLSTYEQKLAKENPRILEILVKRKERNRRARGEQENHTGESRSVEPQKSEEIRDPESNLEKQSNFEELANDALSRHPDLVTSTLTRYQNKLRDTENPHLPFAPLTDSSQKPRLATLQVLIADAILSNQRLEESGNKICLLIARALRECNVSMIATSELPDRASVVATTDGRPASTLIPIPLSAPGHQKDHLIEGVRGHSSKELLGYLMAEVAGQRVFFTPLEAEILRSCAEIVEPYWEFFPSQNTGEKTAA